MFRFEQVFGEIFYRYAIIINKPKQRSWLRIRLSKIFFITLRYIDWYMRRKDYASVVIENPLPQCVFSHSTPLIRKLKNVDMWLQQNKVHNLKIATQRINGIIIKPGQTFSFWRLIGKPSRFKGYKEGMILNSGRLSVGMGGGLCQLTNLIYWMTLHTPLFVVERYRHSYDVFPDSDRTQPFGSGATCVYNYRDLQIFNGTEKDFQIIIRLTDENLEGELRSNTELDERSEIYEKNHHIYHTFWGGYIRCNELYKRIFNNSGQQIKDEFVTKNEAIMMYQPFLEESKSVQKG